MAILSTVALAFGGAYINGPIQVDPATCGGLLETAGVAGGFAFGNDGEIVEATKVHGTIRCWRVDRGRGRVEPWGTPLEGDIATFSPSGATLVVGDNVTLTFRDLSRRKPADSLPGKFLPLTAEGGCPTCGTAALGCATNDRVPYVQVPTAAGLTNALAFSPDERILAEAGDRAVALWDHASGRTREKFRLPLRNTLCLKFSPDGRMLATGGFDGVLRLWDLETRTNRVAIAAHGRCVSSLAFSSDGRTVASSSWYGDRDVRLWDPATGRRLGSLRGHTASVICLASRPGGPILASAGADSTIRLWDMRTGRQVANLRGEGLGTCLTMAFSRDGRTLVAGGIERRLFQWDLDTAL